MLPGAVLASPARAAAPTRTDGPSDTGPSLALRRVRLAGYVLLSAQLVAVLAYSVYGYRHFSETYDFGVYNQAWTAIAHGHLNPYNTLLQAPFWRNNAEFVLWPLAGLYWVYPHPIDLLLVQDLAVVATEVVTFRWLVDVLQGSAFPRKVAAVLAAIGALVLVFDPWAWNTIAFDFHAHTIATLFVVLTGRDLWQGRTHRCWIWAIAAILTDAPGALYIAGVGAAAVCAGPRTRRAGAGVMAAGAAWFVVLTQIGGDGVGGGGLGLWYGYLVGTTSGHPGLGRIAVGALTHPGLLGHMWLLRWPTLFEFLVVAGFIGVFSPWGLFPAAVVFLPTVFNSAPGYLRIQQSFQSWAAIPFLLIGSFMVLDRLWREGRWLRKLAVVAAALWLFECGTIMSQQLPALPTYWLTVSSASAHQLSRLSTMIPPTAEVAVDNGVLGRFADRSSIYQLGDGPAASSSIPVDEPTIVFVFTPTEGVGEPPLSNSYADMAKLSAMGATTLVAADGVYGFELHVPEGVHEIQLP